MSDADVELDVRAELGELTAWLLQHLEYLQESGTSLVEQAAPVADVAPVAVAVANADSKGSTSSTVAAGLDSVREALGDCQRCKLAGTRTTIVFGVGARSTPLLFVGEAPGAEEDRRGEPFVGAAGQLLDKMISAMGWSRDTVYICNVLKCRPPQNRDPQPDEVAACEPFLYRQIEAVAPRLIVTLGKPAAQLLLNSEAPISALRGRFHEWRGIKVMPTFHPAFLLRSPDRKRDAWSDLKLVIAELERLNIQAPFPARS